MSQNRLRGWNHIVFTIVKNNFKDKEFSISQLYEFEPHFKVLYPKNFHIKEKLRQTIQKLRNKGIIDFLLRGRYQLLLYEEEFKDEDINQLELVYLLSNDSIPGWVKIGRTNQITRRMKELYNTSVPLPFKLEETIHTKSLLESSELERSIHSIIDTINPELRKNTEASRREFFKLSTKQGRDVFRLVTKIMKINLTTDKGDINENNLYIDEA